MSTRQSGQFDRLVVPAKKFAGGAFGAHQRASPKSKSHRNKWMLIGGEGHAYSSDGD
jgi:hypothetical protein